MCTTSSVNDMVNVGDTAPAAPMLSPMKFRHSRDKYLLVDIREADEIESKPLPEETKADAEVSMGRLFRAGRTGELDDWKKSDKTIVLLCPTGRRALVAATELKANGFDAAYLARGMLGLDNVSAVVPDLLVLLCTKSNAEKITLAITAASVAATAGETVVLALMSDGICTFLRKGNNKEAMSDTSFRITETFVGEPYKPCDTLLAQFLSTGNGVVLGCKSCVKNRKFEFGSDLLDCVKPTQMPDLLRMLGEAKKNLQFM